MRHWVSAPAKRNGAGMLLQDRIEAAQVVHLRYDDMIESLGMAG